MPATYSLYVGFEYDGGGIVLRNLSEGGFADAVVENCYFYGEMRPSYGGKNIGGIVCFNETGLNTEGKRAIVRNCYVEDNGVMIGFEDVGLIVAYNSPLSLVENCYGDVWAGDPYFLTSSLHTPKIFIEEFGDFLMPCHQQGLCINVLVQW